jgi:hypothetical protein
LIFLFVNQKLFNWFNRTQFILKLKNKMSDNIVVIRVISQAGRSRIEIQKTQTLLELKNELATRLAIDVK